MERTVQFPGLGLEFTFNNTVHIGPISLAWYGIIIAAGLLLAILYAYSRFKKFGVDEDKAFGAIFAGIIGGIIGARVYYVAFSWADYGFDTTSMAAFWKSLYHIVATWEGGMAIYGGLIGALVFGLIAAKITKVKILPLLDVVGLGFLIGQGIYRWGNFINVEAFGSNTTMPWGMTSEIITNYLTAHQSAFLAQGITVDPNMPVHPCFLYESIWCLLGFVLLHFYSKRRKFDGEIFLLYLAWYGLGRSFIEGLRTDSLMIGPFRVSQLLAVLLFVGAMAVWGVVHAKIRGMHDPEYLKLYAESDEWKNFLVEKAEREKVEQSKKEKKLALHKQQEKFSDQTDTNDADKEE